MPPLPPASPSPSPLRPLGPSLDTCAAEASSSPSPGGPRLARIHPKLRKPRNVLPDGSRRRAIAYQPLATFLQFPTAAVVTGPLPFAGRRGDAFAFRVISLLMRRPCPSSRPRLLCGRRRSRLAYRGIGFPRLVAALSVLHIASLSLPHRLPAGAAVPRQTARPDPHVPSGTLSCVPVSDLLFAHVLTAADRPPTASRLL